MVDSFKSVNDTISKCKELNKFISEGYQVTKTVAEEFDSDENGKALVNELREMVIDYAKMERDIAQYCSAAEQALTKFRVDYANCDKDEKLPDLYSMFEESLSSLEATNNDEQIQQNKEVVDFTQTIWNLHNPDAMEKDTTHKIGNSSHNEDDEIEMTCLDDTQKFICPITKGELVDPVKSKLCGHTFSRKAVVEHIKHMKTKAKCPIAGCISSISLGDLENDNVIAFQLRKKNRSI